MQTAKPLLLLQMQDPDLYCLMPSLRTILPSNAPNYMEESILEHLPLRLLDSHIPILPDLQNNVRIKPEIQQIINRMKFPYFFPQFSRGSLDFIGPE